MPVACNTSALTGQEGSIYFKPAGTSFCLLDHTDFPAGSPAVITVPTAHDYRAGDAVKFTEEGTASIDSGLVAYNDTPTTYLISAVTADTITVTTSTGAAVTLAGDGGVASSGVLKPGTSTGTITGGSGYTDGTYTGVPLTGGSGSGAIATITVSGNSVTAVDVTSGGSGYANADSLAANDATLGGGTGFALAIATADLSTGYSDTPGEKNHIRIEPADFAVVCQVREFSVEISREELDVTTLPCDPCGAGGDGKYAQFRKTQSGYASGTGSMTVYFTDDQTSLANRLLANVMLRSQEGAEVKLYINTECAGGQVVDADSIYIESGISITSMSLSVTPDDATSAELSFTINNPKHILTTDIT